MSSRGKAHRRWVLCSPSATTRGEMFQSGQGSRSTAHWGVEDPAAAEGDDDSKRKAFLNAFTTLRRRIELFLSSSAAASWTSLALSQRLEAHRPELRASLPVPRSDWPPKRSARRCCLQPSLDRESWASGWADGNVAIALLANTAGDRRDAVRFDHNPRPDQRSAFESRRECGVGASAKNDVGTLCART